MRNVIVAAIAVLFLDGCINQAPYPSDAISGYALAALGGLAVLGLLIYIGEQSKDIVPDYY